MKSARRLGLLGGSFDPIHRGHLHAARAAQEAHRLDRVVFVPAARPPHKPGRELTDGAQRLAMVSIAIAPEPTWTACDLELRRAGPSYTVDTVRALPRALGEPDGAQVWLILGSDNLPGLLLWRDAVALLRAVQPVIVLREGDPEELPPELVAALPPDVVDRLRGGVLRVPPVPGQATDLRAALASGEGDLDSLPPGVGEYIRERGLYGARP